MRFYVRIDAVLDPSWTLLEVGCGRGAFLDGDIAYKQRLRTFKGRVARVIGIDVDPVAAENPTIDEFRMIEGDVWPVESESVDAIVSDYVMEHVPDPDAYFREAARVLKKGGHIFIRTCNKWHYVYLVSSLVPNRHHAKIVGKVQDERKEEDVFPTLYRCNTRTAAKRMFEKYGFDGVAVTHEAEPSYLKFNPVVFAIGKFLGEHFPPGMRSVLYMYGRKKG